MIESSIEFDKNIGIKFYSTDGEGIGGKIKENSEGFRVTEDSEIERDENGSHLCLVVRKKNLNTEELLRFFSKEFEVDLKFIGYAGNKDKNAVTVQKFSIPLPLKHAVEEIPKSEKFEIIDSYTTNRKIRLGFLLGNYFEITVNGCAEENLMEKIEKIKEEIFTCGIPNFFGNQRFGANCNSHIMGRLLVKKQYDEFIEEISKDRARNLDNLIKSNMPSKDIVRKIPVYFLNLFIAAYQSYLFNLMVSERMKRYQNDYSIEGDFIKGKQPAFPIVGYKSKFPSGEAGEIVNKVLEDEGIEKNEFKHEIKRLSYKGTLRKIDMNFKDFSYEIKNQNEVNFKFWLEKGSYATIFLREFCKNEFF